MAETDPKAVEQAEQATIEQQATEAPDKEASAAQEVDWEAKYNEMKAHSRKWEDRAKKNEAAAKELDEIRQSQMTEAEKAAEADKRAQEAEAKLERMALVQKVSSAKKVPADLLKGDTEEELEASADALLQFAGSIPPQIPTDQGGAGKTTPISKESIKEIKNPIERLKAREALNALV